MDPGGLRERRLQIARRILAERLGRIASVASSSPDPPKEDGNRAAAPQLLRTRELHEVLRSPLRDAARFYVRAELRLVTTAALEALLRRLLALQTADRLPHARHLNQAVVQGLQSALCGCSVRLGFLLDASQNHIDFTGDKTGSTTITRPSPCFECVDSRGLVDVNNTDAPGIVLFAPVIEANTSIGVLEIRGMVREGQSLNAYERSPERMKTMLQKGSYR